MYVLYEDSGNFKAEKVFSHADASLQVESDTGRRSKIKASSVLFHFDAPEPAAMLAQAQELAGELEVDFLWECAPQDDIEATEFAQDYFGHPPTAIEKAALIFALHGAPAYFHRRGKGRYRPAPPEILQAALAAIEKKRKQQEQQEQWTQELVAGNMPEALASLAPGFLIQPDKNSIEWKAFDAAVKQRETTPEKLLLDLGVWPHTLALHRYRFLATHFPRGTGFPETLTLPPLPHKLPLADVTAYSLDDSNTTEVDDALSIRVLEPAVAQVGVHIAVPSLAIARGSELDDIARRRMSTVYTPGDKISMLPAAVIDAFSLKAGEPRPCLSLYVDVQLDSGEILSTQTRLEQIIVAENLHHHIFQAATQEALDDVQTELPYNDWVRPLWRVARHLMRQRETIRGKPELNNRVEYGFELDGPPDDPDTPVRLVPRLRDAPMDLLVAEYMILANNVWGGFLHQHGLPGIYRSQQAGRVRMSTHPLPHDTIGVPQYAWSTSPLRRYVDLVNQSQIVAAAEHGVSARLVAPFKPKDADLFAIISGFDSQYSIWKDHQSAMERYWCLRWLQQQDLRQVQATVLRDDLVRLNNAPLVTRVAGLPELERGQVVTLDILGFDELELALHCRLRETVGI